MGEEAAAYGGLLANGADAEGGEAFGAAELDVLEEEEGGGFGVDVVTGTTSRLVGVTTGLYSNTLVQISGTGITSGTRIEVPSS